MIAFFAKSLFTPLKQMDAPVLLVKDGVIVEVRTRVESEIPKGASVVDLGEEFGDAILAPGFIDIHIHGGAGHDVMQSNPEGLAAMERALARSGVCSYFPTTVTAPLDDTLTALERLADAIDATRQSREALRAVPLGIHLEGPFISHARRGVHSQDELLQPTVARFERFWQAARGHIRLMTIAPELEGAMEVIAEAARRGVCVSVGHADADFETARAAVDAGARHATHTFNAMRALGHREPGTLGEVLTDPRLTADIIADGIHVDPAIVRLFLRAKGPEAAVLITDAISATGMPDGCYRLGWLEVEVKDGKCLADGKLAGSVLTMDRAIRNIMRFADWDLQQALRLATANPAAVVKLQDRGRLEAGARADFVVLNSAGEVLRTVIAGQSN